MCVKPYNSLRCSFIALRFGMGQLLEQVVAQIKKPPS